MLLIPILLMGVLNGDFSSSQALQEELGIYLSPPQQEVCTVYLINQGSTDWSEVQRLQGWNHVSLNARGKAEAQCTAEKLSHASFAAIYTSSLQQAVETAAFLQAALHCPLHEEPRLRGEYHGRFEGYTKEQYTKEPHFQLYDSLPPNEEIFFPCGEGGESKADAARRMIPAINEICSQHIGDTVVVVTHGGLFKLLNFYLHHYSEQEGTLSILPAGVMVIQGDGHHLFLAKRQ